MSKIAVITDTNSGLSEEYANKLGIYLLPMPFYIEGDLKYEGIDFSQKDFYKALAKNKEVSTSMPIVGNVMAMWDELLKQYDEIVYIPMSSGLSASCETAMMIAEDYDGRVAVVDNHRIAPTMVVSAVEAKELAEQGKSAMEIKAYLEEHALDCSIYIMVDTLKYLRKGGRLTPAVAAIGTILRIKPVLQIQGEKLDTFAKARTIRQGKDIMLDAIKNDLEKRFKSPDAKGILLSVCHTDNEKEAEIFKNEILERYPDKQIVIAPLALSIACHIGPGALAVTVTETFIKEI